MSFEIKDKELAGRIGKLVTKSGIVETPAFFPVINPFRKKDEVPSNKIKGIGFNQVITNAYIIMQRLGNNVGEGGVRELIGFDGVVMTDSGAYQLLMYGRKKVAIDPEEIVEYEKLLRPDIAVIADIPTRDDSSWEEARESVNETLRRAKKVQHLIKDSNILWVLPIQGGVHYDLVELSARIASSIEGYGMYAIGSPVTVLEKYEFWKIIRMVATAKAILPPNMPVHLFGGGHPLIMPLLVGLGIDSFDSASYILYAREGRYITERGTYRINELSYLPCECEVCSNYTLKELMEMNKAERTRLIAIHNLHVINRELKVIKESIKEGRLWELIEERARSHPSVREAFNEFLKYVKWIERLDPRYKGRARGLFLSDITSYFRPELLRHRAYIVQKLSDEVKTSFKRVILIPALISEKPLRNSKIFRKALREGIIKNGDNVFFYLPFFNYIPLEIDQTYPYGQFEIPLTPDTELVMNMLRGLSLLISKTLEGGGKVLVLTCRKIPWAREEVIKILEREGVKLSEICE